MEDQEAKSVIESLLFMAGEPLTLNSIRKIIEVDKYNTERLIRELIDDYALRNGGVFISEVADGFHMVSNPSCSPWIRKLLSTSVPKKLSQSSLETLAIIAYQQPIIKAEIEAVRGVNSDGVVKTLLERRLIKILGRKEVPGRPLLYGTTPEFLQYFGLKNLSELPTLKEFDEVDIAEPPEINAETLPEQDFNAQGGDQSAELTEDAVEPPLSDDEAADAVAEDSQMPSDDDVMSDEEHKQPAE